MHIHTWTASSKEDGRALWGAKVHLADSTIHAQGTTETEAIRDLWHQLGVAFDQALDDQDLAPGFRQ